MLTLFFYIFLSLFFGDPKTLLKGLTFGQQTDSNKILWWVLDFVLIACITYFVVLDLSIISAVIKKYIL